MGTAEGRNAIDVDFTSNGRRPPPEPPEDYPPDPDEQAAAEDRAADLAYEHVRRVHEAADRLRIQDEARALVAAEKAGDADFTDQFLTRAQLRDLPAPQPLIEHVLPRHAYAILRGRDHSFKSFVAVDWACCLATGKPWQQRTATPTRVLYIAGEGAHGLASRIDAWEYGWGTQVDPGMLTIRRTALNMHQPGPAFDHLLDHVHTGGYGLVIVDTLRRVSGAADGNGSEMGLVVDNFDRLKHATDNGTVLAVAHTDKGDNDTRGYSGIEDDADVVWAAHRSDSNLTLDLTKMKDGPDGTRLYLEATRTLHSLTLASASPTTAQNTTANQAKILEALQLIPVRGATGPELMRTAELPRSTFYRALGNLLDDGHVANTGTTKSPYYELPALPLHPTETGGTDPLGDDHD